jgi:hypothetical protein
MAVVWIQAIASRSRHFDERLAATLARDTACARGEISQGCAMPRRRAIFRIRPGKFHLVALGDFSSRTTTFLNE